MREYTAIVLLDEPGGRHFCKWVEEQIKTIETRTRKFIPEGDIVICCSNGSKTKDRGKAVCIVHAGRARLMTEADVPAAKIEFDSKTVRYCHDLSNWRYFSRKFTFSKQKVRGTFQSIFVITIPEDVEIR